MEVAGGEVVGGGGSVAPLELLLAEFVDVGDLLVEAAAFSELQQAGLVANVLEASDALVGVLERLVGAVAFPAELGEPHVGGEVVVLEELAQLVAVVLELGGVLVGEAVERELLGGASFEELFEAVNNGVVVGEVALDLGLEVAAGDVEARFVAVAGEGGEAELAVEVLGAEHERPVNGRALGLVGGQRVAVVEVSFAQVAGVERDLAAAVELDFHPVVVAVDLADGPRAAR